MLQHIYFFSGPMVLVVAIILGVKGTPMEWWQVTTIMAGAAIWDFGWHSWAHHRNVWTAHIAVRILGVAIVLAGALS